MSESVDGKHDDGFDERVAQAREFLEGILERMDIDAEIHVQELDDRIRLEIECEDVQRVIGRRGQLVDGLQHLVAKRISRLTETEGRGKPLVVDAGGYREREMERLQSLASRMAEKARRQKAPVELSPMTAHDRRVVHMALADTPGIATWSEGEGDLRHVVVGPESDEDSRPSPAE